jgi:hypothetical protein
MTKDEQDVLDKAEVDKHKAEEQRINDIANRAAADHAKRLTAKFDKALEDRDAKIAALMAENENLKVKPSPSADGDKDPIVAIRKEFEARLSERDKKIDEERQARELERKARLDDEERAVALAALGDVDITGELQKAAFLRLKEDKFIGRDDAGQLVFLIPKDGYTDKLPLKDGIKTWADSAAGKVYQAPKGVAGSGAKPNGVRGSQGRAPSRAERVADARAALADAFFGGKPQS